jgi:hypothetical protein
MTSRSSDHTSAPRAPVTREAQFGEMVSHIALILLTEDDALALTYIDSLAQLWKGCYEQRTAATVFNDNRQCSLADAAIESSSAWHIHRGCAGNASTLVCETISLTTVQWEL